MCQIDNQARIMSVLITNAVPVAQQCLGSRAQHMFIKCVFLSLPLSFLSFDANVMSSSLYLQQPVGY